MRNESAGAAKQTAQQLPKLLRQHNLTLVSAGVAFYAFLAFVPALIVIVTVYGLVAEPADIQRQIRDFASALPDEVQKFIQQQITSIGSASGTGVSITLVIAIAIALWSASGGMAALVTGVNVACDQTEPKSFMKKRGKALALTFGAVVLLVVMMFLIAALPSILVDAGLGTAGRVVLNVLCWPVLTIVMVLGLGVLYRIAVEQPNKPASPWLRLAHWWPRSFGSSCRGCSRCTRPTSRATARPMALSRRLSWRCSGSTSARSRC